MFASRHVDSGVLFELWRIKNKERLITCRSSVFRNESLDLSAAALATFAAAAVATATASAVTAVAASTTATTGRPRLARARLVYRERPALNRLAVQLADGVLRFLIRPHGDKGKAARFAGEFVLHQHDFLHRAGLREELLEFVFGRVEGEITYV